MAFNRYNMKAHNRMLGQIRRERDQAITLRREDGSTMTVERAAIKFGTAMYRDLVEGRLTVAIGEGEE